MAIGADRSLPSRVTSPLRAAPAGPSPVAPRAAPSAAAMAPRIDDRRVADQSNNLYARTGAKELALQGMDKAGISRGKGQQFRAEMAQAQQSSANRADAMRTEAGASQANVSAAQQYEAMRNSEKMSNEGLLQNLRDSERQERMARQSAGMDAYETALRGQFNLDSMQLDYTPLLRQLLS